MQLQMNIEEDENKENQPIKLKKESNYIQFTFSIQASIDSKTSANHFI